MKPSRNAEKLNETFPPEFHIWQSYEFRLFFDMAGLLGSLLRLEQVLPSYIVKIGLSYSNQLPCEAN